MVIFLKYGPFAQKFRQAIGSRDGRLVKDKFIGQSTPLGGRY